MLDARKIYRKVTSKVNDFSPEQLQNLVCIVHLYRGDTIKLKDTINNYLEQSVKLAKQVAETTQKLNKALNANIDRVDRFFADSKNIPDFPIGNRIRKGQFDENTLYELQNQLVDSTKNVSSVEKDLEAVALQCKNLRKPQDKIIKELIDSIAALTKEYQLNKNKEWQKLNVRELLNEIKELQQLLSGNPEEEEPGLLHETEYFFKQSHWLTSRFPQGVYTDVEGLCKVVTQAEIEAKDWSLSPGRYVGVSLSEDEDYDYEERLKEIHIELEGLNEEAIKLADTIRENYKSIL
ncbi:hypothetical protein [Perlabentimonas gracilis]|uniref:hypothetical protein n=1 Tax=Perlabentimonas gracilis TaxID=2715279 RepID=UPI001C629692|nr:hypothetical protein [Perlabentimonas gracilis]